jgi:DNA polymerase III epsilon subunit-like protein
VTARVCFVDCETTGLDPGRHEVYEIALIETDGSEHLWWVKPEHLETAELGALVVGRYYERRPAKATSAAKVAGEVARLTAGRQLVGACPWFDAGFLEAFLRRHGQAPAWHHRHRCVESMVAGKVGRDAGGLRSSAMALGVAIPEEDDLHTALGDARLARAIYVTIMAGP